MEPLPSIIALKLVGITVVVCVSLIIAGPEILVPGKRVFRENIWQFIAVPVAKSQTLRVLLLFFVFVVGNFM